MRLKKSNDDAISPTYSLDQKVKKPFYKKLWLKIVLAVMLILVIASSAYAYNTYKKLGKVIQKNSGVAAEGLKTENVTPEKLNGEGDGRVNILLLGVGDKGHSGEKLSDTIIVASYDPKTHDVAMLSIPRDLYVSIDGEGYAKINAAHAFGEQEKEGGGPELAKKTVSQVLGIPIHYYVRADFTALKQAVDVVGGIDVTVKKDLVDPEYPCSKQEDLVCGFSLMAGQQHLNGSAALKYSRCRKGDCGDDYGRAQRQQDVLVALRQKAMQQNILMNPAKITDLIGIVSNNIRTDLQPREIQRLAEIAKATDPQKITTKVLDNETNHLVVNDSIGNESVVVPAEGIGSYKAIQAYVRSIFVDGYIKQEAATIELQNATGNKSQTALASELLKSYNYNVVSSVALPTVAKKTRIIDNTGGKKPYTIQYLQKRLNAVAETNSAEAPSPTADITVILGADY